MSSVILIIRCDRLSLFTHILFVVLSKYHSTLCRNHR